MPILAFSISLRKAGCAKIGSSSMLCIPKMTASIFFANGGSQRYARGGFFVSFEMTPLTSSSHGYSASAGQAPPRHAAETTARQDAVKQRRTMFMKSNLPTSG